MKKLAFLLLTAATFLAGVIAVRMFGLPAAVVLLLEPAADEIVVQLDQPLAVVEVEANSETVESDNPLDKVWVEDDIAEYGRVSVTRVCEPNEFDWNECKLTIRENGTVRRTFKIEHGDSWWLRYGFFDLLGNGTKQLVVHTYSGGAHCCFDYAIFDLEPRFRLVYDSSKYDSGNEIGYDLVPVDIDSDGVYEFHQRIEAFSYFHASYAGSNKPTALFAYDQKRGAYVLANKRFPEYILADTQRALDLAKENPVQYGDAVYLSRETFLNYVYAGKKERAWEYFERNYNFRDKDEYRRDVRKLFSTEPVYLSIYGKRGR